MTRQWSDVESSSIPALLIPARCGKPFPWRSMLVAASGERAADGALGAAAQLAGALDLPLTVLHCALPRSPVLGEYADAPHHEYRARLAEMLSRGVASCTPQERRCVREVRVCRGDPATELLRSLERMDAAVLALGWHGAFGASRAPVLAQLLDQCSRPLLVVRGSERPQVRLC